DLDWADVEGELEANRDAILAEAQNMEAPSDSDSPAPASPGNVASELDIDFLLDVQLNIQVEVGRSQIRIEDLLELDQGSIVELQSAIGEPLDIRVNEKLVARGEIVVINDKFAVRITDIISPDDRFAAL
ncbi:MAG: flagellar motor switch protein FliN, partial [SAR324 cluster bacterium]|nr:flagellar motor switch protein FliN [SAR324 cluster bacterium]